MNAQYNVDLIHLGPPLVFVYVAADVGSIGGGWISSALLRRGATVNRARKTAMLVCALAVTPVMLVGWAGSNLWLAVTLIAVAASAHQGWSANLYTVVSDLFPRRAVASVVGLGGMGGSIGGMLTAPALGLWLDWSHRAYGPVFVIAGLMYVIALLVIHAIIPRMEPARV